VELALGPTPPVAPIRYRSPGYVIFFFPLRRNNIVPLVVETKSSLRLLLWPIGLSPIGLDNARSASGAKAPG